ncbi:MAG: tetratricopeptide repeat protein [Henriciella sp.]|nr:tetratricopeptide repeat protein [Henriciella sp.]
MFKRLCLALSCCAVLISPALAQFGPKPPTPRVAKEIQADRAMVDASELVRTLYTDVVTEEDGIDPDQANKWYTLARNNYTELCENREAATDFWARNCYKLADIYRRGLGVTQNYRKASELYTEACLAGRHLESCLQQAHIDHVGNAGAKDWPNARQLYQTACDMGDASGCAGLGNMLYRGQGGAPDRIRGARLLQDACSDEYTWACERIVSYGIPERRLR